MVDQTSLRNWNTLAVCVHAVLAIGAAVATNDQRDAGARGLDFTRSYYKTRDNGTVALYQHFEPKAWPDVHIGYFCATFFALSALFHLLAVVGHYTGHYTNWINNGINPLRWHEYALSSSVMICAIAALAGCLDVDTHILLFSTNAAMNWCGLWMERAGQWIAPAGGYNPVSVSTVQVRSAIYATTIQNGGVGIPLAAPKKRPVSWVVWEPFVIGSVVGAVPWVVVWRHLWPTFDQAPVFVQVVVVMYQVLFFTFPVNTVLQYRARYTETGPWADYEFGELVYILLSLLAKSCLGIGVLAGAANMPVGQ